jgi:hypothetical protein
MRRIGCAAVASFQSVADLCEHRADFRTHRLQCRDDKDCDERGDQRILDRGDARVVVSEILHRLEHWAVPVPNSDQRPTRFPAARLNAVRLQLHALADNLGNFLRTLATPEPIKDWSLTSLKERLIKTGAKIVSHGRYVAFQMAEVAVPRTLFADILRLIAELRPPPVISTA